MAVPVHLLTIALTLLATSCQSNTRTVARSDAGSDAAKSVPSATTSVTASVAPSALDSAVASAIASAFANDAARYASALASCESVAKAAIPADDEPSAAEKLKLRACDSEALYFGIDCPADFVEARKCAYAERARKKRVVLSGAAILTMLYANGKGVQQNLELAERFACELDSSQIELAARVEVLNQARQIGRLASPFDICDYDHLTSGFWVGACAHHDARLTAGAREMRRVKAMDGLPPQEASAFVRAAKAFSSAHVRDELDLSGTMSDAIAASERTRLEGELADILEALGRDFTPPWRDPDAVEKELNTRYREVLSWRESRETETTPRPVGVPTPKGIRNAERLWLLYREAFSQLVSKVHPQADIRQWRAWITEKRNEMLRSTTEQTD